MIQRKSKIVPKPKKCKGTGQATGYGCGKLTKHRKYGLGKMCCYADWLLTSDAGIAKLSKAQYQVQKPRLELEKAEKEKKERTGITTLIKSVVNVFHEYVRLRDKHKPCIACGTPWKDDFQASHFFKAELYSTLKFHEDNVHGGCVKCNIPLEGNLSPYAVNLPNRIGLERFEELNRLAALEKQTDFKWCREQLIETRKYYNQKLKELKNR